MPKPGESMAYGEWLRWALSSRGLGVARRWRSSLLDQRGGAAYAVNWRRVAVNWRRVAVNWRRVA